MLPSMNLAHSCPADLVGTLVSGKVVVSYCKLDYASILDTVQLRVHTLRTQLRKDSQDRCMHHPP